MLYCHCSCIREVYDVFDNIQCICYRNALFKNVNGTLEWNLYVNVEQVGSEKGFRQTCRQNLSFIIKINEGLWHEEFVCICFLVIVRAPNKFITLSTIYNAYVYHNNVLFINVNGILCSLGSMYPCINLFTSPFTYVQVERFLLISGAQ